MNVRYGPMQLQFSIRLPVWVSVPLSTASEAALHSRLMTLQACGLEESLPIPTETFPDPYIKIHVDFLEESYHESYRMRMLETTGRPGDYFYDINDERWNDFPCRHRHDTNVCKCKSPLYHIGQDEAVFKQNALPSHYWTVKGRSKLRPKTEGQGIMISAVFCEFRGFGLPLKPEEVEKINAARALNNVLTKILPSGSPGLIFFQYGKGKEGYWDGLKFQAQCIDFLSVLEILYPTMQVLLEVDHSSGHLKEQSDGLMVNAMGLRWGGKTTPKRDTLIEEGCLGDDVPMVGEKQLAIGMVQKMIFEEGDPPPFLDQSANVHDRAMNAAEKAKEVARRKNRKVVRDGTADEVAEEEKENDQSFIVPGYVGKNKGINQVFVDKLKFT
jgi:hypothetical protein